MTTPSPTPTVQVALDWANAMTLEERQGLREYWDVYEDSYEDYLATLMERTRGIPQFAQLFSRMSPGQFEEQLRGARRLFRGVVMEQAWGPYLEDLRDRTMRYAQNGVEFRSWYLFLGAIQHFMLPRLRRAYGQDPDRLVRAVSGMQRWADIVMMVLSDAYQEAREGIIFRQQQAIRELSTPILQVRPGLSVIPIIGVLDSARSQQLMDATLAHIREKRTRVLLLDVTGVASVDSDVANRLLLTVEAAQLLGASAIVTGISAGVALTIVSLGLDLSTVITKGDLQSGIEEAEHLLKRWEVKPAVPGEVAPPAEASVEEYPSTLEGGHRRAA